MRTRDRVRELRRSDAYSGMSEEIVNGSRRMEERGVEASEQ